MKILHTSDLHLGKTLLEESLLEDQKYILNELIDIINNNKIDLLIIAGDIYDKSIPSSDAINLFNDFLLKLSKLNIEVLITNGNHDSKDRLGYGSKIFDQHNIHIVTEYNNQIETYEFDNTVFYMLPFLKPFHIRKYLTDEENEQIKNSNDMMRWIINKEVIDKSKKNILIAHQFVMGTGSEIMLSDSESGTNVGTLDAIDANIFKNFDYVALGHIHRPQKITRESIRYSGTPLKYSFSEANDNKSVVLIDTKDMSIELLPIKPLRNLRVIKGNFNDIMNMESTDELLKFELTDDKTLISPMQELRKKYPNALALTFKSKSSINKDEINENIKIEEETPYSLFSKFFMLQNSRELNNDEKTYLNNIIEKVKGDE